MIKIKTEKVIDCQDWDDLVKKTYNKPYCFQQQWERQDRGSYYLNITTDDTGEDDLPDQIPFQINGEIMGVTFKTWLTTSEEDINSKHPESYPGVNILYWERNFYPNIETIANDLCKRGLIEPGEYTIKIDW